MLLLQCLFGDMSMPQYFCASTDLDEGWTQCPTLDVVLYQVSQFSKQWC